MNTLNKSLSLALATLVSMPALAENLNIEDFSIGGRIEARGVVADGDFDDASRVRLNGQGKSKINDSITAVGKFEYEVTQDEDGGESTVETDTRYLFVGAETAYGSLTYGTQDNAVTYLTNFTDLAEVFSGYTNENVAASADRAEDTLLYTITKDALTVHASANLTSTESGGGLMAAYKLFNDFEVSAGYAGTEGFEEQDSSNVYLAAARYNIGGLLLSTVLQTGNMGDYDFDAVDAYAAYEFGKNNVNISYNYFNADDSDDLNVNFVAFEYARYMGNVAAYASYKLALNDDASYSPTKDRENEFLLGARYSF